MHETAKKERKAASRAPMHLYYLLSDAWRESEFFDRAFVRGRWRVGPVHRCGSASVCFGAETLWGGGPPFAAGCYTPRVLDTLEWTEAKRQRAPLGAPPMPQCELCAG